MKKAVEDFCRKEVANLSIASLFPSYDMICQCNLYQLGLLYESIFANSLAVKYYLCRLSDPTSGPWIPFEDVYSLLPEDNAGEMLFDIEVDFSSGIYLPQSEATPLTEKLPLAVIHNRLIHNAHHDILLATNKGFIPVSAKASFALSDKNVISSQLQIKRKPENDSVAVPLLIWLFLGASENTSAETRSKYPNVAFIDGSGVCSGVSYDKIVYFKKLKSEDYQEIKRSH